ncbi:hypothetical protein SPRG_11892 [Saprolegnia parasitica CBS 223.65]|uniref:Uncharacterized protein n=1 Tax=Saprolegnia parasitica (strain CBS 223.65) TaxID=695850 RepID=A0A067C1N2_SAPPC|nr:hypothetical protein SPRG_11892 [Saprolegnia parasitica CBS 223.65]KDO23045.1 hypothetical protein SPRG_11892 [Saprolegnia parasitica CBS 223.65]|eukprot:XP_012206162.1 hypothetical protein SPRG_11892 [Saprolegnia parasitica CBS 223.65]
MSFNMAHDRDVLNGMTYYEVLKLAKTHHVQSTKYRMSKAYMINALLGMDPKSNVDYLDCEDKIAAAHDFRQVQDEVEEYIFQHDLGSTDVLLISWNEASISHIAQALKVMTNAVPHWSSMKSMEAMTHEQLLDELMAYLCFGIERVGRVMVMPETPMEWLLLGQRLRDISYDRFMQDFARFPNVFPLATFTQVRASHYTTLPMLPMPHGMKSLFE